jgi:hypothetical protein
MVKFEDRGYFKSVLWAPFDPNVPIARDICEATNLAKIESEFKLFCDKCVDLAKAKVNEEWNGFRASITYNCVERKPRGWNKAKLKHEQELTDETKD